jgi:uncharacterized repeat protein (TIGR01451 family)
LSGSTNISPPTIIDEQGNNPPKVGDTLHATTGSWTGSPSEYTYEWEDCKPSGNCTSIFLASRTSTYRVTEHDLGNTLRVVVSAHSGAGASQPTPSPETGTVGGSGSECSAGGGSGGSGAGGTPLNEPQPALAIEEPEASFTIEKLQEIACTGSGFTAAPLTGAVGETVDYEIVVKNTGNVPLTLSSFTDVHCDAGTIAGGPGASPVAPGASTTYTCSHLLASKGAYDNVAAVTATTLGEEGGLTVVSPEVEVTVP